MRVDGMEATQMTYTQELDALITAFRQRQQRFPTPEERVFLQGAAYEIVYGPSGSCGHQLTEYEAEYYQNHSNLDKLCKRCVMEERAR